MAKNLQAIARQFNYSDRLRAWLAAISLLLYWSVPPPGDEHFLLWETTLLSAVILELAQRREK